MLKIPHFLLLSIVLTHSFSRSAAAQVQITISGRVTDEGDRPIAGALILLEPQQPGPLTKIETQNDGSFSISRDLSAAGPYWLSVFANDYYDFKKTETVNLIVGLNVINVRLIKKGVASFTVEVIDNPYTPKHLEIEQVEMSQSLSADQLDTIPATRSTQLESMLAILPGITKDAQGQIHLHGSPADQTNWLFNGFNIADPLSGRLETNIGVENIGGLNTFTSRYSVEYGAGSGGTLAIDTKPPTDQFKIRLTDFFPGFQTAQGLAIDSWGPKMNFSGPLKKNRAWFFIGANTDYKKNIFLDLPADANRTFSWNPGGVTRFQFNLAPRHYLSAGLLYNHFYTPAHNLGPLNPLETTLHRLSRRHFFYLKEQFFPSSRSMLEVGYARYFSRHYETPRGQTPYQLFDGRHRGNAPFDVFRESARQEVLANVLLPPHLWLGHHQVKGGLNLQWLKYFQDVKRNSIESFRINNTRSSQTTYLGNGRFSKSAVASSGYLQDRWTIPGKPWLLIEGGTRWDHHSFLGRGILTPRFSSALMPPWFKKHTKFSTGFGLVPEKGNLRLFSRHLDQAALVRYFPKDGQRELPPILHFFTLSPQQLTIARSRNFSFAVEQEVAHHVNLQFNYLHKRTKNGYAFFPVSGLILPPFSLPTPAEIINYHLENAKQESYDFFEVAVSKQFFNKYDWFGSYGWSRASSNAAADISADEPIIYSRTSGRMAWDAPHRLISWGIFPLDRKRRHEVYYFLELKDGTPYSLHDDEGAQIGELNAQRLPRQFTLNGRYSVRIRLLGYNWRLQIGLDNLTNHLNPLFINQNISSPGFGTLYGHQPRRLALGLRFLGK